MRCLPITSWRLPGRAPQGRAGHPDHRLAAAALIGRHHRQSVRPDPEIAHEQGQHGLADAAAPNQDDIACKGPLELRDFAQPLPPPPMRVMVGTRAVRIISTITRRFTTLSRWDQSQTASTLGPATTRSSPSQSAISRSSSASGPPTFAVRRAGLQVGRQHPQAARLAVAPEVDARHQTVAQQERQHVVAVGPLVGRRVDLDPVAEAEQPLGARALPDQRVERRQQGARLDPARQPGRRVELGGLRPALHRDRQQLAGLDQLGQPRRHVGGVQPEVVAQVAGGRDAQGAGGERAAARAAPPRARVSAGRAPAWESTRSGRS